MAMDDKEGGPQQKEPPPILLRAGAELPVALASRKSGPAPPVGTGPEEVLRGTDRTALLPTFKLLTAMVAKQNSTAREKPVHPIKPA
jgi:hypothetical protein